MLQVILDYFPAIVTVVTFLAAIFALYKFTKEPKIERKNFYKFFLVLFLFILAALGLYSVISEMKMERKMERNEFDTEIKMLNNKIGYLEESNKEIQKTNGLEQAALKTKHKIEMDSLSRLSKKDQKEIERLKNKHEGEITALEARYLDRENKLINEKSELNLRVEKLENELIKLNENYNSLMEANKNIEQRLLSSNEENDSLNNEVLSLIKYIKEETISSKALASFTEAEDLRKQAQDYLKKGKKNKAFEAYKNAVILYEDTIRKQKYGPSEKIYKYIVYCLRGMDRIDRDKIPREYEKYNYK